MYCKYCGKHHCNRGLRAACHKRFKGKEAEAVLLADAIGDFLKIPKRTDKRWRMEGYLARRAMGYLEPNGMLIHFPKL